MMSKKTINTLTQDKSGCCYRTNRYQISIIFQREILINNRFKCASTSDMYAIELSIGWCCGCPSAAHAANIAINPLRKTTPESNGIHAYPRYRLMLQLMLNREK